MAAQIAPEPPIEVQAFVTVEGVVVDERSGEPLQGAAVWVRGTRIGMVTGDEGVYRLEDVPYRKVSVQVTRLGYIPEERELWVCTRDVVMLGGCPPRPVQGVQLRFYMRPVPRPGPWPPSPPVPMTREVEL